MGLEPVLSAIVVARNEEKNIERCIASILKNINNIESYEILLVDSSSEDRTVDIAQKFPINIIKIKKGNFLSPSAGRFIGVEKSRGKYCLIIDADMELLSGWVENAVDFMQEKERAGGVIGRQYDRYILNNNNISQPMLRPDYKLSRNIESVEYLFGSAVFNKSYLINVGNFNPFLRGEEEADVSYRMRRKGYELYLLPFDSIYHYCIPRNVLRETIRRKKLCLYAGLGDLLSVSIRSKYYILIWDRFHIYILFIVGIIFIGSCMVFGIAVKNYAIFFFSIIVSLLIMILLGIKKRSVSAAIVSLINISIISIELIRGVFRKVENANTYPRDVIMVKRYDIIKSKRPLKLDETLVGKFTII